MKHTITLAALAAAVAVVSCSSDDMTLSVPTQRESVTAQAEQGGTRAVLDNKTPKWEAGDKLAVRYDAASYTAGNDLTLSAGEGTARGTFTGELTAPPSKTNMEFYYPAATAAGEYDITEQDAATPGKYIVMYAKTAASTAPTFAMTNKTAVLKINFTAPSGVTAVTSATVKGCYSKGTLGADGAWSGTGTDDITLTGVAVSGGNITGTCVVLPGTAKSALQVEIVAGGKTYTSAAITATGNIEASKTYTLQQALSEQQSDPTAAINVAWVPIQGGTATINSKQVTLSDYEISATEITNAQWVAFLNEVDKNGDKKPDAEIDGECPVGQTLCGGASQYSYANGKWSVSSGKENFPAAYVTWYGAKSFATHYGVKLMTECQFEYAAHKVEISDGFQLNDYAWTKENSGNAAHAVGTKTGAAIGKNGEQVYDLLGNLWEWCQDWNDSSNYPSGTTDPTGPTSGSSRVFRGGCWSSYASSAASSDRDYHIPNHAYADVGFRVAR